MSGDGQRGPGSGGTADRGRPGAGQARQHAGGESPPGDGQDHAGTPRPDVLIPAHDEGQLAALREVWREWDRVSAEPQVWRQALPVDPSLGEYPKASELRPARFTPFVPVAGSRPRAFPRRRSRRWSYIVASEELGRVPGLMAAAGLLIDYIMTVAVSIASGVAAITSAYPSMQPATVWIGVGVIVILWPGTCAGYVRRGPCSPYRRTPSSRRSPPSRRASSG